ncbi:YhhA family cyclophane-containing RiPP [Insolitispirillum peregrinum]|uniref:YhhA family cyclophane-containing RiPP n=1 Tax=Insolitispirillum peregrinum TaxID=80876 RepID=UPI0036151F11
MSNTALTYPTDLAAEIRTALLHDNPTNQAIQRLKIRLLTDADASEVITSYDRMHHRHNRS